MTWRVFILLSIFIFQNSISHAGGRCAVKEYKDYLAAYRKCVKPLEITKYCSKISKQWRKPPRTKLCSKKDFIVRNIRAIEAAIQKCGDYMFRVRGNCDIFTEANERFFDVIVRKCKISVVEAMVRGRRKVEQRAKVVTKKAIAYTDNTLKPLQQRWRTKYSEIERTCKLSSSSSETLELNKNDSAN